MAGVSKAETDLSGKVFGKLTVIDEADPIVDGKTKKRIRRAWNCLCECGEMVVRKRDILISGKTQSCGCIRRGISLENFAILDPLREEIITHHSNGKSVTAIARDYGLGRSTVLKYMEDYLKLDTNRFGPQLGVNWVDKNSIRCNDCDEIKSIESFYRSGDKIRSVCKSCCIEKQSKSQLGKPRSWSSKHNGLQTSARKRGLEFDVSPEYLEYLAEFQDFKCVYTLIPVQSITGNGSQPDNLSFDRFDTERGYVEGNLLVCATRVNNIKYNQTLEEFKEWMPLWYKRGKTMLIKIEKANET